MSKNLPENQPSEEIDLGQLFKLIGNAFERLFKFIGNIFYKLFLVFVWGVFFTKRHFWKLVISIVLGVGLGLVKQMIEEPIYKSTIVIRQNFNTGEHLFNTINYYNSLIQEQDSSEISKLFKVPIKEASEIKELNMESNLTENEKMILFDEYTKSLDSVLASEIKFEDFTDNSKDYNYKIQKLTLKSTSKSNFSNVLVTIVDNIEESEHFSREREKRVRDLEVRDSIINKSLIESQNLQEVYKEVLKQPLQELPNGATSIAIGDSKDRNVTKEYELFSKDLELRRELADNDFQRKNLEQIIEIISIQNGDGTLDNQAELLGFETNWVIAITVKITFVLYLILLLLEFVKFLERYKDEVS